MSLSTSTSGFNIKDNSGGLQPQGKRLSHVKRHPINQSNNLLYQQMLLRKYNITRLPMAGRKRKTIDFPPLIPNKTELPAKVRNLNTITTLQKLIPTTQQTSNLQITSTTWHPSTKRLLGTTATGEFTLWNTQDYNLENVTQGHDGMIKATMFTKNGDWLVSGDDEGIIKIWQGGNLRLTKTIERDAVGSGLGSVVGGISGLDGLTLGNVRDLSFNWDDLKFVACGDDKLVKIYDFQNGVLEKVLKGHNWDVNSCDWHSEMGLLLSGSKDNMIKLWDPRSGKCVNSVLSYRSSVNKVRFQKNSSSNYKFYSLGKDAILKSFDLRNLKAPFRSYRDSNFHTFEVDSLNGDHLTVGLKSGALQFYDTASSIESTSFYHEIPYAHNNTINGISWSPRGNMLVTNSTDKSIGIWSRGELKPERPYYNNKKTPGWFHDK
ncbi:hypothetical protein QEN19_003999 [Hanseniaspora menglaensis]